ncbi:MAG: hypothetical protein JNM93_12630 [Bacteriovoracaceae bacterium]|nr:hypothetical protein [Bacteriovoracaceae bacterium]
MIKKFYIVTGKGGVGKSLTAHALCLYLKEMGYHPQLVTFRSSGLDQNDEVNKYMHSDEIDYMPLVLAECVENYIASRLNSKIIAKGIIRAPFFRALINMIPGFNYLIYLGQILQTLHDTDDEKMVLVLDSPASGHALTMLESVYNFQSIFQSGIIYDDTTKMLNQLNAEDFCQVNIVTLPSVLAMNEALEFEKQVAEITHLKTKISINNMLSKIPDLTGDLPTFLKKKIQIENEVVETFGDYPSLPHSLETQSENIIKELIPGMENLV